MGTPCLNRVPAKEQQVAASTKSPQCRPGGTKPLDDCAHFKVVADNQPVFPDKRAQFGKRFRGKTDRHVGTLARREDGDVEMSGHDPRHACIDRRPERRGFNRVQAGPAVCKQGQRQMRVDIRITVTRPMLGYRQDTRTLLPTDGRRCKPPNHGRVGTETSGTDNRILWVRVHINDWSKVHVDTERTEFTGNGRCRTHHQ